MSSPGDTNAFFSSPDAYDDFMGRYAQPLAKQFVTSIPLSKGDAVLDVGCGPGALTAELVNAVGAASVSVIDPSPPFLKACVARYPGITGNVGRAEEIPFADNSFDAVMSQLVLHFIGDTAQAGKEIARVTKPGGRVAMCTWWLDRMDLLAHMDRATKAAWTSQLPTARVHTFDDEGVIASYLESMGLEEVSETTISVQSCYGSFEELWQTYLGGIGPTGPWMLEQPEDVRKAVRAELFNLVGEPDGEVILNAVARSATGQMPDEG